MANKTKGEVISRTRKRIKAENQDSFITDRYIYSVIEKHAAWLLRREDNTMKIIRMVNSYQTLDYVDLIDVDKVKADCTGIKSNCTIKRTQYKIPDLFEGYFGPLIRTISSIDGSEQVYPTTLVQFTKIANSKNFKYNKTRYYWIADGYVYFPNLEWDAVVIDGVFRGDISDYKCSTCDDEGACAPQQDRPFNVPEYLHGELENFVIQEILGLYQLPPDTAKDKQHLIRS